MIFILFAISSKGSIGQDEGGGHGCLVLDGEPMHEFGNELAFVHVGMAECEPHVSTHGGSASLVVILDGEELSQQEWRAEVVRLTMPLIRAGPHELVIELRSLQQDIIIDEVVYTFFTSDFQPKIRWEFPPPDYVFKRNSQRQVFLSQTPVFCDPPNPAFFR